MAVLKSLVCYLFCIIFLTSFVGTTNNNIDNVPVLPFCDENKAADKSLVFVSTLDGKFSALHNGELLWNFPTGPDAMLSSSIHRLELTSKGHWVRMIPSLSGRIYKFDGDSIEPVPVNAEQLLKNSFRYSDDLVISGGRETRTYGVDIDSGKILYECTLKGCENLTSDLTNDGHILVLKRDSQTIRAIEPRTGTERWNYSVAQHELKVASAINSDCHNTQSNHLDDIQIKVIVPDGLICAISKKDPSIIIWKYKFEAPVVHAWEFNDGDIQNINLFSGNSLPHNKKLNSPSLYIGMHQKQLYIQESVTLQRVVEGDNNALIESDIKFPWKPYPAASNSLIETDKDNELQQITMESDDGRTTALSVLYGSEYVNGNGFYLYNDEVETCTDNETVIDMDNSEENDSEPSEIPVQIIVSLWYWWKEVLIISITTAIIFNIFFTQRFLNALKRQNSNQQILIVETKQSSDSGVEAGTPLLQINGDFSSRYLDDFEQVRCLGKGGFGVVFEAKKKIDDCCYAVKRIQLPFRKESRDRVMREVKALAKLEHPHIVRYYHSWIECPPPGWQEEQDKLWHKELQSRDSVLGNYEDDEFSETGTDFTDGKSSKPLLPMTNKDISISYSQPQQNQPEISDSMILFQNSTTNGQENHVTLSLPSNGTNNETESESISGEDAVISIQKPCPVFLYIQMQLCQKESLQEWLQKRNQKYKINFHESLNVFHQINHAVEYVHQRGLIHRDLKPSNIFFSMDGCVKVGDFGLVTDSVGTPTDEELEEFNLVQEKHTANVGTRLYMSPEQMLGLPYDHKVDIYSLGIILFELLWIFSTGMERAATLQQIREKQFPKDFMMSFSLESELLLLMLSHLPNERPSAQEIREKLPQSNLVRPSAVLV